MFLALFVMEMCLKIIALGFWWEQHTYLTDNWNRLDFVAAILASSPRSTSATSALSARCACFVRCEHCKVSPGCDSWW